MSSIQTQLSALFPGEDLVPDGSGGFTTSASRQKIFVKVGQGGDESVSPEMLKYEFDGLTHLRACANPAELYIPKPILCGTDENGHGFICVEHLNLSHDSTFGARLGKGLANMHKNHASRLYHSFGFPIDGCCGSGQQMNDVQQTSKNWIDFWKTYRLGDQLFQIQSICPSDVRIQELGAQLMKRLPELFSGLVVEDIVPSVLHGDMWSGNWSVHDGRIHPVPALYDPAVYYGHNEADFGIANMFGGFGSDFFHAYHSVLPRQPGCERRAWLYELHHHLNHYQIFGSIYRSGAIDLMKRILDAKSF